MLRNIEAERGRKGLSQKEAAAVFGCSTRTYRNWISEKTAVPSTALVKMARFFGTSVDYLLANTKE